jgi:ribosome modulation factor
MSAYDEGFQTGKAGGPANGCPYQREGIKSRDWRRGWQSGRTTSQHINPDRIPNSPAVEQDPRRPGRTNRDTRRTLTTA